MHITDTFYEMNILGDLNVNEPQDMHYIVFYQSHYQIEVFDLVVRTIYMSTLVCSYFLLASISCFNSSLNLR